MRLRWGLVALALVAAACGSEDTPGEVEPTTVSSTTSTPATTDAPATTTPLVTVDPNEVGTDGDAMPPSTTADRPPPTTEPPPAPIPATTLAAGDRPTVSEIGRGRPQWFSTDGSTVIVAAYGNNLPTSPCEGIGEPLLFRQPRSAEPRTVAVLGDHADVFGVATRPSPGRLAVAEGCLGLPLRLWAGDEAANGLVASVTAVTLDALVVPTGLVNPSADGAAYVGSTRSFSGDVEVVRVDAESGQVSTLFAGDYFEVVELADGTFLAHDVDNHEVRRLAPDGTLLDSRSAGAMGASADRSVAVIFTDQAIVVDRIATGGTANTLTVPIPAGAADQLGEYLPVVLDDATVVFTRRAGRANPVWELRPDGSLIELLAPDEWGELVASADGTLLATSRPAGDTDEPFAEDAVVIER